MDTLTFISYVIAALAGVILLFFGFVFYNFLPHKTAIKQLEEEKKAPAALPEVEDKEEAASATSLDDSDPLEIARDKLVEVLGAPIAGETPSNSITFDSSAALARTGALAISKQTGGRIHSNLRVQLENAPTGSWSWWDGEPSSERDFRSLTLASRIRELFHTRHDVFSAAHANHLRRLSLHNDALTLELELGADFSARDLITSLEAAISLFEKEERALLSMLFDEMAQRSTSEHTTIDYYSCIRMYHMQLLGRGENKRADELFARLIRIERHFVKLLVAFDYPNKLSAREREEVLIQTAREVPSSTWARRAMEALAEGDEQPTDWLDLLALHTLAGDLDHSSGQWFAHLLAEAPRSKQARQTTDTVLEMIWGESFHTFDDWGAYLGTSDGVMEGLHAAIEYLLGAPAPFDKQRHRLFAAVTSGMQPERYGALFQKLSLRCDDFPSKGKSSLLNLLRTISRNLDRYEAPGALLAPLGGIAKKSKDSTLRQQALHIIDSQECSRDPGTLPLLIELLAHFGARDEHELHRHCAGSIISHSPGPQEKDAHASALEAIIASAITDRLSQEAIAVYPRETPYHYNYLLAVDTVPQWLFETLLGEAREKGFQAAIARGLCEVLTRAQHDTKVWNILEFIQDENLGPYGGALEALSENRALSSRVRERAATLIERWRAENAHLVGGLSLDESPGTGQLTMAQGGRGGLSIHEDQE